jgi:hypothetical protein
MSEVRHGRRNPWRTFDSSILEDTRFTTVETLVYIVIESHATTTDQRSFPSYNTISNKAKCGRSTAIRAVKKLVEHNLIYKIERFKGKTDEETGETKIENTSNLYVIFPASEPFDPDREWIDQNGIVHDKGVVPEEYHPSIIQAPPLVSQEHHPSITGAPRVVSQRDPNKTITNKTINKTNINKTNHQQSEIEQAQLEVSATKEKDVVVEEVKSLIANVFETEISNQQSKRLIAQLTKHGKNLEDVVQQTRGHFLATNEPINDLMAALTHGIKSGWDKPKSAVVAKMPRAITNKVVESDMTPEELQGTIEDIHATMHLLRSTEKQVLADKLS